MAITIQVSTFEATINGLEWASTDKDFLSLMRSEQDLFNISVSLPSLPNYELACALYIADQLGGRIISNDGAGLNEHVPGRIY